MPIGYTNSYKFLMIQYLLLFVNIWSILVTQPMFATFQACRKLFFYDAPFSKSLVLGSPSHVCYVSGLPQALSFLKNDMPFSRKVCFCQKLNFLITFSNICPYLSMYLPTVRYCVPYGTAYLPTLGNKYVVLEHSELTDGYDDNKPKRSAK